MKTYFDNLQGKYHDVEERIYTHSEELKIALAELKKLIDSTYEGYISPQGTSFSILAIARMESSVDEISKEFNNK